MVTEESSVVAAAANSAKFWSDKGGFKVKVLSTIKVGQVHFIWNGDPEKLKHHFPLLKSNLINNARSITRNMEKRGGGIQNIELVDMRADLEDYYQLKAEFETVDSMGANFINSCLEEFANTLKEFFIKNAAFDENEKDCNIIMAILSNYTPKCLVECWVETGNDQFENMDEKLWADEFVWKFEQAVRIAQVDIHRATTHNKGIFNGIDAVAMATGNDFRAIEACGHTYASRDGGYRSLTDIETHDGIFRYSLKLPLALGTVGGVTSVHPLAKRARELLGNPGAEELMMITAAAGLANNYGALRSLVTKGIQMGHMKMHLVNILNYFKASDKEKNLAVNHFKSHKVSFSGVSDFLEEIRS
jgi:hydroxymethylglutaryl-CoA reductase